MAVSVWAASVPGLALVAVLLRHLTDAQLLTGAEPFVGHWVVRTGPGIFAAVLLLVGVVSGRRSTAPTRSSPRRRRSAAPPRAGSWPAGRRASGAWSRRVRPAPAPSPDGRRAHAALPTTRRETGNAGDDQDPVVVDNGSSDGSAEIARDHRGPHVHDVAAAAGGRVVPHGGQGHGADHRFAPHRVPYRANLWALRALGVRQVVTTCAVGGLVPELAAGTVVVPDQVIDRTWGRAHTYYDVEGPVVHVPFADLYCPRGRVAAAAAAQAGALPAVDGGTMVVIQGPRFSSRAESRRNARDGGTIVNMTAMPEAALARELALCCTTLALVTDGDAGVEGGEHVTQEAVLELFARNLPKLSAVLEATVAALPDDDDDECDCRHVLDGQKLPITLP
ncbi:hypothetical protein ACFT2C_10240 [Promicromonospora sp. NPDC057138]|uniref:phosphorylase family protein n=1 Tax=Promicromonospora sp. NPDC057138 TaxID=3346031 RepID=UPI00363CA2EA